MRKYEQEQLTTDISWRVARRMENTNHASAVLHQHDTAGHDSYHSQVTVAGVVSLVELLPDSDNTCCGCSANSNC